MCGKCVQGFRENCLVENIVIGHAIPDFCILKKYTVIKVNVKINMEKNKRIVICIVSVKNRMLSL
jgi:hypothetical protein